METAGVITAPRNMRSFLVIWFGQLISMLGSGLTTFGLGVWIYQKTGQATPFALTVLFGNLPRILLMPLGGMLADRWNRRWLMILADTGSALITLAVVILASSGQLDVWHIYIIACLHAVCSAFQEPAYRASVVHLVPKKDLARASGMSSISEALTMLASPLLAGLLFSVIGLAGLITIDFITYFFALAAMLLVRIPQPKLSAEERSQKASLRRDMAFAWRYLVARPGLFWMVWYFALVNFFLNFSAVLMTPLVLGFTSVSVLGALQMAMGSGLMVGSVAISAWGGPRRRIAGVIGFIGLMAVGLILAGLRPSPLLTGLGGFLLMFSLPFAQASSQAITQTKVEPSVQGRVFAMRSMISQSMTPLAFLMAGLLADRFFSPLLSAGGPLDGSLLGQVFGVGAGRGIGLLFAACGLLLILVSLAAWSSPRIRNVEHELPDVLPNAEAEPGPAPETSPAMQEAA